MVGSTAQLIALACYFNARVRGLRADRFFHRNSTCKFCEHVRFVGRGRQWFRKEDTWLIVAANPDQWLSWKAKPGRYAFVLRVQGNDPRLSDWTSSGFVGGAGRWLLAVTTAEQTELWEAKWQVVNRKRSVRSRWRVTYCNVATIPKLAPPLLSTLETALLAVHQALTQILEFAEELHLNFWAEKFRKAIGLLSANDPLKSVLSQDLAPPGLLDLDAQQLLAACEEAWVFGGMGSWNDLMFEDSVQERYEELSAVLYAALNEGICASANSAAVSGACP